MTNTETQAERKAAKLADMLKRAGYEVRVTVERKEAEFYSDGDVMFAPRVLVHVFGSGRYMFDDTFSASYRSNLPAKGHRASTAYLGGRVNFAFKYRGRRDKKLAERHLIWRIQDEIASYERRNAN